MPEYLSTFTDAELEAEITAWKAAFRALSGGQSYTIQGRSLTRAALPEVRQTLTDLAQEKNRRAGTSGPRLVTAIIGRDC